MDGEVPRADGVVIVCFLSLSKILGLCSGRTEVVNRMKCNVEIKLETDEMLHARADLERFK